MAASGDPPTLYEWAGGREAFERLINAFYDRVEGDELISPLFPWWRQPGAPRPRDPSGGARSSADRLTAPTSWAAINGW
jgi:hypothetical protein